MCDVPGVASADVHNVFLDSSIVESSCGLSTKGLVFETSLNESDDCAMTLTDPVTPEDEDEKLRLG
mgnify:CR=1 FL=1